MANRRVKAEEKVVGVSGLPLGDFDGCALYGRAAKEARLEAGRDAFGVVIAALAVMPAAQDPDFALSRKLIREGRS
jgi:hypothetical protein